MGNISCPITDKLANYNHIQAYGLQFGPQESREPGTTHCGVAPISHFNLEKPLRVLTPQFPHVQNEGTSQAVTLFSALELAVRVLKDT